jgi:hypothetical protein
MIPGPASAGRGRKHPPGTAKFVMIASEQIKAKRKRRLLII